MKYQLRNGEHVREIAEHFGFSSTKTIADHPDNASVVSERGGIDHLVPGDVFTIPEGTSGRRQLGTGRGHDLTVSATPGTFVVKLESAFRLRNGFGTPDGEHHGNLADSPNRWAGFGKQNLTVIGATITVSQSGGGLIFTNITNRKGEAVFPHLDDGRWVVSATPDDNELSPGAARAAPGVDHGLGFYEKKGKPVGKPQRPFPANGTYEVEYRPVELELTVSGGAIESATMDDESVPLPAPDAGPPTPPERPPPAVPFWRGIGEGGDRQALHLDWKPDFIRRVKRKLRPFQRERKSVGQLDRDVVVLGDDAVVEGGLAVIAHGCGVRAPQLHLGGGDGVQPDLPLRLEVEVDGFARQGLHAHVPRPVGGDVGLHPGGRAESSDLSEAVDGPAAGSHAA